MDWQIIYTAIDTYAEDLGPFADLVRAGVLAKQAESDKARQAHAEFQAAELAKQIDVLAMIGELLVVVELKAQPVTERTVGQVMRYKAAVENALTRQIWVTARARGTVYEGEARARPVHGHRSQLSPVRSRDSGPFRVVPRRQAPRRRVFCDRRRVRRCLRDIAIPCRARPESTDWPACRRRSRPLGGKPQVSNT